MLVPVLVLLNSLNQESSEEISGDLAGVIINGLSILVLVGILGGLLFVLWREFSKEDEEVSYNYDSGISTNFGEDGRSVPSANTLLGDDESYQPSKIVPELPPESIMIEAQAPLDTSNGPPLPESGLPEGWTMEQWQHYGEQWLNQQK